MHTKLAKIMLQLDNRPVLNVKPLVIRRRETSFVGPYSVVLETSCGSGPPYVKGFAKISLFDARQADDAQGDWGRCVATKRFQVDNWRECEAERLRIVAAAQVEMTA